MNKQITITRYGIQENEDGELLITFSKKMIKILLLPAIN